MIATTQNLPSPILTDFDATHWRSEASAGTGAAQGAIGSSQGQAGIAPREHQQGSRLASAITIPSARTLPSVLVRSETLAQLHKTQKLITTSARLRSCCEQPAHNQNASLIERADGTVGLIGLARCGITNCLNCGRVRAMQNAERIHRILLNSRKAGCRALFGTFGVNSRGNGKGFYGEFYKQLVKIYQKTFTTRYCQKIGIQSHIRSLDMTLKRGGTFDLNLHFHIILILEKDCKWSVEDLYSMIYQRWAEYAFKLEQKTSYSGNDLQEIGELVGISKYLGKCFDSLELVARLSKESKFSFTIPMLIDEIAKTRNGKLIAIYQRIELALKGKRQIAYSKGTKIFDVETEVQIAEDEAEVIERTEMTGEIWRCFKDIRTLLVRAWCFKGMARDYFTNLCELAWLEFIPADKLAEHKLVFLKAYEWDLSKVSS